MAYPENSKDINSDFGSEPLEIEMTTTAGIAQVDTQKPETLTTQQFKNRIAQIIKDLSTSTFVYDFLPNIQYQQYIRYCHGLQNDEKQKKG